jgi:putative secretion ATPase (PEP-CTERM system associated)
MYERFFDLRERPFSLSPDPNYLYPSRKHSEALSYIRYGIEGHAAFVVVTGEVGCGKTTLLQTALRSLDERTAVSRLVNTILDPRELLEAIMLDFGLDVPPGYSKPHLLHVLAKFVVDQRTAGRSTLLIVDEAQNLSIPALEELRMLSNLETERSKLIQIILVGQPTLRDGLALPELEQLRQRITVSYHLQALDQDETAAYINHRLRRAARGRPMEFSRDVTDLIHTYSQGVPRKINVIADAVLLFGYGEDRREIDVELTRMVLTELRSTGVLSWATFSSHSAPVPLGPHAAPVPVGSHAAPVPPGTQPRIVDQDIAARAAAADAEYERLVSERRRVLQERWMTSPTPTPTPTLNAVVRDKYAGASRSLPVPPRDHRSAVASRRDRAAAPVGADPYYRAEREIPRSATWWDRMREFWTRAKAVGA